MSQKPTKFLSSIEQLIDSEIESERFAHKVLDASLNGLYIHDVQLGQNVFINNQYTKLTGYTLKDLQAMDRAQFFTLFHPDDLQRVADHIERLARDSQDPLEIDYRFKTKDDRWIWCLSRDSVFSRNEDGSVAQIIGTFFDLTERKQVEEKLDSQRELLQSVFDNIPIMLVMWDPQLQRFTLNRHAEKVLGWTTSDANEGDFMSKAYPDAAYREKVAAYMQSLESGWREWSITTKDGARVISEWANIRLSDDTMIGIGVDLRERKRMEDAMRESELKYRSAFKNASIGFAMTMPDGLFVDANPAYCSITGYQIDELRTLKFSRLIHPEDFAENMRLIDQMLMGQINDFVIENRYLLKNGEIVWVRTSISLVRNVKGAPQWIIALIEDITERKQLEETLREINQELTEYSYALTHNLKAPLRAIQNYVNFLFEDLADTLKGEPKKYLEGIKSAVTLSNKQFEDLEILYRIKNHPLNFESFEMRELLDEIQSMFKNTSNRKLIYSQNWPVCRGERFLLRQLLLNLINNGFKFNRAEMRRVEIGWQASEGNGIEIFVHDNGIGINPQYQDQIFDIFRRLHTESEYDGTGIGLAIVKRAVQRIGGKLRLKSTVGEGSTFYINLPNSILKNNHL